MIALIAIAAVILAVLVAPVGVHIKYSDDFALWLSYAGIRFRIIPAKEKKNEPQKEKSKHNGKNQKTKLKLSFDDILQLVGTGVQAIKKLVRILRIRRFKLAIVVSGEDAASAAINYGRVCALASASYPVLEKALDKGQTDISVDLEYDSKTSVVADIIIKAMTVKIIIVAAKALFAVLPIINKKNEKGGRSNEQHK